MSHHEINIKQITLEGHAIIDITTLQNHQGHQKQRKWRNCQSHEETKEI